MSLCRSIFFFQHLPKLASDWSRKSRKHPLIVCILGGEMGKFGVTIKHSIGHRHSPSPSEFQIFLYSKAATFNGWCQTLTSNNMFMTTKKIALYSESHHQCAWTCIQLIAPVPSSRRHLLGSWGFCPPLFLANQKPEGTLAPWSSFFFFLKINKCTEPQTHTPQTLLMALLWDQALLSGEG